MSTNKRITSNEKTSVYLKNRLSSIESKTDVFINETPIPGIEVPNSTVEIFPMDNPILSSNKGRDPIDVQDVSFLPSMDKTVPNPWVKERRWIVPKGLTSAYLTNYQPQNIFPDYTYSRNPLVALGTPVYNNDPIKGDCILFDGVAGANYVRTRPDSSFNSGDTLTIVCWAKANTVATTMLWGFSGDAYVHIDLFFNTNLISLNTGDSATNFFGTFTDTTSWHHFVCQIAPSDTRLYVDGVSLGTATYKNPTCTNTIFQLSGWPTDNSYKWNGKIKDVLMYNRILSPTEISTLYNATELYTDVYDPPSQTSLFFNTYNPNIVSTQDLNDSNYWNISSSYHTNYNNVFDEELQKTVWQWTPPVSTITTYLFDNNNDPGSTGLYSSSLMIKSNYAITVSFYMYGALYSGGVPVPPNTWTLIPSILNMTVEPTGIGWRIASNSGGFASDTVIRACSPVVINKGFITPYTFNSIKPSALSYTNPIQTKGTIGIWFKPFFNLGQSGTYYLLGDTQYSSKVYINFNPYVKKYSVYFGGVYFSSEEFVSHAELHLWTFLALTYDFASRNVDLHIYSYAFPEGRKVTSTGNIYPVQFQDTLYFGGTGKRVTQGLESNSLFAEVFYDTEVWSGTKLKEFYDQRQILVDSKTLGLQTGTLGGLKITASNEVKINSDYLTLYDEKGTPFVMGGAIVEDGENALGKWIKFENGTMMCVCQTATYVTSSSLSSYFGTTAGVVYYASIQITHPVSFRKVLTLASGTVQQSGTVSKIDIQTPEYSLAYIFSKASTYSVSGQFFVYGLWKT